MTSILFYFEPELWIEAYAVLQLRSYYHIHRINLAISFLPSTELYQVIFIPIILAMTYAEVACVILKLFALICLIECAVFTLELTCFA